MSDKLWQAAHPEGRIALLPERGKADLTLFADAPAYDPKIWDAEGVRGQCNCYGFAANDPRGHASMPQPGEKSGREMKFPGPEGDDLIELATLDGLSYAGMTPWVRPGHYLVALAVAPYEDYHWYRQGPDGLWLHKPGNWHVSGTDDANQLIRDPRDADRGRYTEFHGFFHVPRGGIAVGLKARKRLQPQPRRSPRP